MERRKEERRREEEKREQKVSKKGKREEEEEREKMKKEVVFLRLTDDRLAVGLHPGADEDSSRGDDEVGDDSRGLVESGGVSERKRERRREVEVEVERERELPQAVVARSCRRFRPCFAALLSVSFSLALGHVCVLVVSWHLAQEAKRKRQDEGRNQSAMGAEQISVAVVLAVCRRLLFCFLFLKFPTSYHRALDVAGAWCVLSAVWRALGGGREKER